MYSHSDLTWQYQWSGNQLQNLRLLVCRTCLDTPQQQLRSIVIPADPIPILNPRPDQYPYEVPSYISLLDGQAFTTMDGNYNIVAMMQVTPTPDPTDPYLGPPIFVPE